MSKRKWGDRKDGTLIRNADSMHFIMPIIYPNRCDNEAFIMQDIDLTNLDKYLEEKNASNPDYKYNLFQCIVTSVLKTITLRSKLNRFIANRNFYQRNEVSAAFTLKKEFSDNGGEALAIIHSKKEDTLDTIHNEMYNQIHTLRKDDYVDESTGAMDIFNRMPRFLSKAIVRFVCWLDVHGWVPSDLIATDPYYRSVVLTNIGSIGLQAGYHHLTNWGACSLFVAIGKAEYVNVLNDDGTVSKKHQVSLGFTIDERIADGFYYARSVRMIKTLLENPQLLDAPLGEALPDEYWNMIK